MQSPIKKNSDAQKNNSYSEYHGVDISPLPHDSLDKDKPPQLHSSSPSNATTHDDQAQMTELREQLDQALDKINVLESDLTHTNEKLH